MTNEAAWASGAASEPAKPFAGTEAASVAERFRHAMRQMATTVTIITACDGGQPCGVTATSVTSVAMTPPSLLACLHQQGTVRNRLSMSRCFCVNVLREGQETLSRAFSDGRPQEDRFSAFGERWVEDGGVPCLIDAQCSILCEVKQTIDWGTHTIFLGIVRKVRVGNRVLPLLYFSGTFGRVVQASEPANTVEDGGLRQPIGPGRE